MTNIWNTSVYELMTIFQGALKAILPSVERVRIPWKQGEAYDDWDEIAEVLFRSIMERSLGYALGLELVEERILPPYDSIYQSYSNIGRIEVDNCAENDRCVFVRLSTSSEPFDTIDYLIVGDDGTAKGHVCSHLPLKEAILSFRKEIKN